MAAEIPNLVKRNKIYYFRCRIPSNLTNGRAREVKISLKTGNLTSRLREVIIEIVRLLTASNRTELNNNPAYMPVVQEMKNECFSICNTARLQLHYDR